MPVPQERNFIFDCGTGILPVHLPKKMNLIVEQASCLFILPKKMNLIVEQASCLFILPKKMNLIV
ncbi:hypothetical protein QUA08_23125, partial [Microcoleus sp. T3B2]|uniref:hypothetical protein n=1 Tax=Microcoleus sp. T3B2 TaxID=3055426 RepID=UPI002FD1485E